MRTNFLRWFSESLNCQSQIGLDPNSFLNIFEKLLSIEIGRYPTRNYGLTFLQIKRSIIKLKNACQKRTPLLVSSFMSFSSNIINFLKKLNTSFLCCPQSKESSIFFIMFFMSRIDLQFSNQRGRKGRFAYNHRNLFQKLKNKRQGFFLLKKFHSQQFSKFKKKLTKIFFQIFSKRLETQFLLFL